MGVRRSAAAWLTVLAAGVLAAPADETPPAPVTDLGVTPAAAPEAEFEAVPGDSGWEGVMPDSLGDRLAETGDLPRAARAVDFEQWLADLRAEAARQGIGPATLDRALAGVQPIPRVVELDRRQPESRQTFRQYLDRTVPSSRVTAGRRLVATHRQLLEEIGARYGVPPSVIVALWGIESDYGRHTGGYGIVPALATLAYEGRRGSFFRQELLAALQILEKEQIGVESFRGSWAGAMGQCQFMPSSFAEFAVDHDGDGRRDIWSSPADVFASTANYLVKAGWETHRTWGRVVVLPGGFDTSLAGLATKKPLGEWQQLGVRRVGGGKLPEVADVSAALILPDGPGGPAYLVYKNFEVLLAWNRSTYFATAVGLLSDRIGWR